MYGAVKVGSELLGIRSLARDFGFEVEIHLHLDAKATIGMLSRRGAGSLKHVETNQFWLQKFIASSEISLHKVSTDHNLADLLTKYLSGDRILDLSTLIGISRICKSTIYRQ